MGYGASGVPSTKIIFSDQHIKLVLRMELSRWLSKMNYENYISQVFFNSLNEHSVFIENWNYDNSNEVVIEKKQNRNLFISWELKAIEEYKRWIRKVLEFYNFEREDASGREWFFLNYEVQNSEIVEFVKASKAKTISSTSIDIKIASIIDELGPIAIFYLLAQMQTDLIKAANFLENQYDLSVPQKLLNGITDPEKETFETVCQAVLYFRVLQDANIKNSFSPGRLQKEIEEVVETMILPTGKSISHNSFKNKYYEIHNKNGYRESDYLAVQNLLEKNHPTALPELKKFYRKDLF